MLFRSSVVKADPKRRRRFALPAHSKIIALVATQFVVAVLTCCPNCFAQSSGPANFSGSWTLDQTKAKSDKHSRSARIITALEIVHREPELRMRQTIDENGKERTEEVLYYTDGRGEENMLPSVARGATKEKTQSKSKWEKGRLVIKYSLAWRIASDTMYFDVEETWQLANHGSSLIHTKELGRPQSAFNKTLVLPEAMEKATWVYNRKP